MQETQKEISHQKYFVERKEKMVQQNKSKVILALFNFPRLLYGHVPT